jgi:hypothetical protein
MANNGNDGFASQQQATDTESNRVTGPRTAKDRSKRYALRQGLFARSIVLKTESEWAFEKLRRGVRRDRKPKGLLLETIADRIAAILWQYPRLLRAERSAIQNEERLLKDIMPGDTTIP